MTNQDLIELREKFRLRFREVDFCIGEEQVEIFFRELLGEPEPPELIYDHHGHTLGAKELETAMREAFTPEKVKAMFERDSTFFDIKRKK